jgi:hypothetical protein
MDDDEQDLQEAIERAAARARQRRAEMKEEAQDALAERATSAPSLFTTVSVAVNEASGSRRRVDYLRDSVVAGHTIYMTQAEAAEYAESRVRLAQRWRDEGDEEAGLLLTASERSRLTKGGAKLHRKERPAAAQPSKVLVKNRHNNFKKMVTMTSIGSDGGGGGGGGDGSFNRTAPAPVDAEFVQYEASLVSAATQRAGRTTTTTTMTTLSTPSLAAHLDSLALHDEPPVSAPPPPPAPRMEDDCASQTSYFTQRWLPDDLLSDTDAGSLGSTDFLTPNTPTFTPAGPYMHARPHYTLTPTPMPMYCAWSDAFMEHMAYIAHVLAPGGAAQVLAQMPDQNRRRNRRGKRKQRAH